MRQKEFSGEGSIDNLPAILNSVGGRNIFLVTGRDSFRSCGAEERVLHFLNGYSFSRFSAFSPNPKIEEINEGLKLFRSGKYDAILAVGGGSVIDVAKAIKLFYYKESTNVKPLIAVPTTSGTGSEATYFVVYYKGKEKQSDGTPEITLPDFSICDPQFVYSLPRTIVADTGADALAQAVESYWSIYSTVESREYAQKAIKLILSNLAGAANTTNKKCKANMLTAANLAGKAINITKTTACHSISYPITSYFGIPHGHAASLTLGEMLVYNNETTDDDCNDQRGTPYVIKTISEISKLFGVPDAQSARIKIQELLNSIGLKTRLSGLGIRKEDLDLIIEHGFTPERVKNNPRRLTRRGLQDILERIY